MTGYWREPRRGRMIPAWRGCAQIREAEAQMDYREAITWIVARAGYERGFVANPFIGDDVAALGLRRTAGLLRRVGSPERAYRIVHVAGTKGKGSVSATVEALARAAGWRTGLYTTPHLHTFRERIMVAGEPVSEEEFGALATMLAPADAAVQAEEPELGEPTAFEVSTAMALLAFSRAGAELGVIEVGMGGRLDATNVVQPDVSVVTPVSYDHTAILGDTLAKIAFEKGGIIKPERPVVIGPQAPEALAELERIAAERAAPLYRADRDWQAQPGPAGADLNGPWGEWRGVWLALRGRHQVENAGVALMATWLLEPALLADEARAREALASVSWPGRFERIATGPDIYVDGAHNVDSMARLVETLAELDPPSLTVILGIGRDKDIEGMLATLAPLAPRLMATASHNPRAADPKRIAAAARLAGLPVERAPDVAAALERARASTDCGGIICVTGSLYAVAEAREALGLAETPAFERALLYG
jgi:dihydrofolate synthase/folylpolyglutamate synthase